MFEGVCRCKPVSRSRVLRRGGNWNNGPRAGPFASNSNNDASNTNSNTGFRCTSRENICPRSLRLLGIVDKGVKKDISVSDLWKNCGTLPAQQEKQRCFSMRGRTQNQNPLVTEWIVCSTASTDDSTEVWLRER